MKSRGLQSVRGQAGFSLIELTLVIVLLSILMVSAEALTPATRADLHPAVRKVHMDILYARQMAMLTNVNHGVQFRNGVGYVIYQGNVVTPIIDPFDKTNFFEDLTRYGSVQVGNTYQVEFDRIGRPVIGGGGQVQITDTVNTITLTVTTETGNVVGL